MNIMYNNLCCSIRFTLNIQEFCLQSTLFPVKILNQRGKRFESKVATYTYIATPQTWIPAVDAHVTSTARREIATLIMVSFFVRELESLRAVSLRQGKVSTGADPSSCSCCDASRLQTMRFPPPRVLYISSSLVERSCWLPLVKRFHFKYSFFALLVKQFS